MRRGAKPGKVKVAAAVQGRPTSHSARPVLRHPAGLKAT